MEETKEPERQKKAIEGTAKVKKKTGFKRFLDIFAADDLDNVKEYVITDIIIPAIRDNIVKTIKDVTDMIFYGKKRGASAPSSSMPRVSYRSYYDKERLEDRAPRVRDPEDIIFSTYEDAELALEALTECIDKYGRASIADFYDIAGVTGDKYIGNGYTDNDYGWRNVSAAYVRTTRDGYIISLPRATDIRSR